MMDATTLSRLSAPDFAATDFLPRQAILDPILGNTSLALLYGPAAVGKSFLALGIAWAAAAGTSFLGWRAARPRKVLYVDGEMAPSEMQRRLALFGSPPPTLELSLAALNPGPILDLAHFDSQLRLAESWGRPELVVLDNLASLAGLHSGDPDRWHELQRFLVLQRRLGRAILLVHHANRKGLPRGSSRREDVLDLVMALRRPSDWRPSDGARFEVHFEKARSLHGALLEPIAAHLQGERWHWASASATALDRGVALLKRGLSAEAMGKELRISRASAFRLQRRARELGRLTWTRTTEAAR